MSEPVYLGDSARWGGFAAYLRDNAAIGLDTEFYNVNVDKQSCVGRARIHVWSVATRTPKYDPRGFHEARGFVLPMAAIEHPVIKGVLEDRAIIKAVHNQAVDQHALANHGVRLAGAVNTLGLARWVWPEMVSTVERFGLKNLMRAKLRREPVTTYKELVTDRRTERTARWVNRVVRHCACGVEKCRGRRLPEHAKTTEIVPEEIIREREVDFRHPLETIVPGHPRWDLLVRYAADDAVAALELLELATHTTDPAPYPYDPATLEFGRSHPRPAFNQEVEHAVVAMEGVGIRVDLDYCRTQHVKAEADERADLDWLYEWYLSRHPLIPLPYPRDRVDAIWASPVQRVRLFDSLDFPRSPVWKKGRVKPGEVKLDSAAMDWIARNHGPATTVMAHLLHLARVRAGKKYLGKLGNTEGQIHPICGPAGDDDERAGAVTGRLGMKGEFEAQQMPQREEVDFYVIRRAIVAADPGERWPGGWRTFLQSHDEIGLRQPGGPLVVADYSALEVVVLADLCLRLFGDNQLAELTAPGAPDIHCVNAREVFGRWLHWRVPDTEGLPYRGQSVSDVPVAEFKKHPFGATLRGMLKTIWYGLQYGKTGFGFATLPGPDGQPIGEKAATAMVEALLSAVPGLRKWQGWCRDHVDRWHGIYSLGGRWCPLDAESADHAPEWLRNRGYRRAYNFPMQATVAEVTADAMIRINGDRELLALGVSDADVERTTALLKKHMTEATANGTPLLVPLQVSTGTGWNYHDAK